VTCSDRDFTGSIPEIYDTYLVPLIFESYADDLANRIANRFGSGAVAGNIRGYVITATI
jgi:hypothetical protein